MILIFLITNQNLKKENLMLEYFQETFQSLLNHYQSNFYCYKKIKYINWKIFYQFNYQNLTYFKLTTICY